MEYGSPAEVNCSIPNKPVTQYKLGWESKTSQPITDNETSVVWKLDRLTKWEEAERLGCFFTVGATQCVSYVNLTIYSEYHHLIKSDFLLIVYTVIIISTVYSAGTPSGPFISSHHEESCTEWRIRLLMNTVSFKVCVCVYREARQGYTELCV